MIQVRTILFRRVPNRARPSMSWASLKQMIMIDNLSTNRNPIWLAHGGIETAFTSRTRLSFRKPLEQQAIHELVSDSSVLNISVKFVNMYRIPMR